MSNAGDSGSYRSLLPWLHQMEEEDESDEELEFVMDDDDEMALYAAMMQEEGSSRRPRPPDAPPKIIRPRDHLAGGVRINDDYFVDNPVYTGPMFRRRFRMRRHVFERIVDAVQSVNSYFTQRPDATGRLGISARQKCMAAVRIIAYGLPADAVDEYVRIGESTAREALSHFCRAVITCFGEHYLRAPNADDVARLLEINAARGFPGMLGSIDCMHWEWRNCPTGWKGMFTGRGKHPSMILEAVVSKDLWIWHAYFGMPGSCNDINVLHRSPIFSASLRDQGPPMSFTVNGHTYNTGYYLADGIYPEWATFVKSVPSPIDKKTAYFSEVQEGARKDIERAFGVLQTRFAVVRGPAYGWDRNEIANIMTTCIILHNMIVEDEGPMTRNRDYERIGEEADIRTGSRQTRQRFVENLHRMRSRGTHRQLQVDLIEHNWLHRGASH